MSRAKGPLLALFLSALLIGVALWLGHKPATAPVAALDGDATVRQVLGPTNGCRGLPVFPGQLGFGAGVNISTNSRQIRGLAMSERERDGRTRFWRHQTWIDAGNLAALSIVRGGDIYVIPAPHVSLTADAASRQNRVYRVDSQTAELRVALELPAYTPDPTNPFGTLGLSYDCDLDSLYVSSVAGSTRHQINGAIYQVRLAPEIAIASTLSGVDAMGLAVAATDRGKYLIYGEARTGDLYWVALDDTGKAAGIAKKLGTIDGRGPLGNDRPRRIDVLPGGDLRVHGTPFAFNLAQPAAGAPAFHYWFRFDRASARYRFERSEAPGA